ICKDDESGSATLTVTTPADLSKVTLTDNKSDYCTSSGDHTLSIGGLPTGYAYTYTWTVPDGAGVSAPANTATTLTVPAKMANNGKYTVKVEVVPSATNPCEGSATVEITLNFKLCGDETLTPGNEPGQDNNIAFICQNDAATNAAYVDFTPVDEITAIEKISWYKSGNNFTDGVTGGTQIGSVIAITHPYSWPLRLTQSEVFGSESAPKHYYVRAKIERAGGNITYSSIYRFARVENPPVVANLAIAPLDDTICLTSNTVTKTFTASNDALAKPGSVYGNWGVKATEGVTYSWKTHLDSDFGSPASANSKVVNITGVVNQAATQVKAVSSYTYELSTTSKTTCQNISEAVTGMVTTTEHPQITSFNDGSADAKTICASTKEADYPTLTVTVGKGEITKWEKSVDGGNYVDMGADFKGKASYKFTVSDVSLPAAGTANKVNKYRVTVKNGSKCDEVRAEYTLTVVALPDLASAAITDKTTAPEFEFCASGSIKVNPKKSDGTAFAGAIYKWQKSATGTDGSWTDIANSNSATWSLTAPDNNHYRCVVTATSTSGGVSCPAEEKTTNSVQVTVSESSSKGTSTIGNAFCQSGGDAEFNITGQTGTVTKLEISNASTFPANGTVTMANPTFPYTIAAADGSDIYNLLSTTSRKTTLHVRATVQSGGVCGAVTGDVKTVDVYKPAPKLAVSAIADLCADKSLSANNGYTPATENFEKITWKYGSVSNDGTTLYLTNSLAPKYNDDTTYTLTATVTNTVLGANVCGPTESDAVAFKVNRKAVKPKKSNDTAVCAGQSYTITATRPAKSALVWKKDGAALPSGETVSVNGSTETLTVSNAAEGTYVYTISDVTVCGQEDVTVNVTVNKKPVAGTLSVPAGTNGDFCAGTTVQVTADAGSYTLPTGGVISWQVCTDNTDYDGTRQASLEQSGSASYSKPSSAFTAGTTYYIRYGVSGPTCETEYSAWQAVKVIEKPVITAFTVSSGNNEHICVGTEVTLSVSGKEGLKYEFFAGSASGTPVASGNIDVSGTATHKVTPAANTTYYAVLTDENYHGAADCGKSDAKNVTVNVDPLNVGGKLVFTNTDITGQPTENGKKLEGNVGEHTAQLRLDGAVGTTKNLTGMSDKNVAVPDKTINPTASLPLSTDHMDQTRLWVVVSGGECPDAYSDTVTLVVKVGTDPTLSVTPAICQGSSATLTISVPSAIQNDLTIVSLEYQKDGESGWTAVSGASFGSVTGSGTNLSIAVSETLTATLTDGNYKFRFNYKVGDGSETPSNEAPLRVDAPSVGGTLDATPDKVCQDGTKPVLSLSGYTGEIQGTYFGTSETSITQSVSTGKDKDNLYEVPTGDLSRSGWYQVSVKNGVCPEAKSSTKQVTVIQKPDAGKLAVNQPACYNSSTGATVTLSGQTGSSIVWKTASAANGSYTDVPNTDQTTYAVSNLTDHLFVKVAVTTDAVCAADESDPVEVLVYDTIRFSAHPQDKSVVVGNDITLSATVADGGLKYDGGTGAAFESNLPATYQWQMLGDNGQWSNVSNGNDFGGISTASLTIKAANAESYVGTYFRCVATAAHCNVVIASDSATIKLLADLDPGATHSLTACECYYSTDPATYYVTGAAGQGDLTYSWQVSRDGNTWLSLQQAFNGADVDAVCKGYNTDTIVFFQVGVLYQTYGIRHIRAWVSDEVNTEGLPTTGEAVKVCVADKPVYTFSGNIVCERNGAGSAVPFAFTANPSTIQGREIKYAYALPSDPENFTDIASGTSVSVGNGKSLSFAVSSDNLSIAANSAVPFEADSLILRMEVRSCYTPAPLDKNTDATLYAVLRVDKAPELEFLRDTTICKGDDVTLVANYTLANTTIPGNEVTVGITPGGTPATVPASGEALKTLDHEVHSLSSTTVYTASVKTTYCAAVTKTATVTVKEIPALTKIAADPVCEGTAMSFTATVANYDASTCRLTWQKQNGSGWDSVGSGLTYSKTSTGVGDAGKYRLRMELLVPSCAETQYEEFDFKVKVTPELTLTPAPYPGNVMVQKTKDVTVTASPKSVAAMGYDPDYVIPADITGYEWYIQKQGKGQFEKLDGTNHTSFVNSAINEASIKFVGIDNENDSYDSTLFYVKARTSCDWAETQKDTLRVTDKFSITSVTPTPGLLCENDPDREFVINVRTTLPPSGGWGWQVSTDNGTSWSDISDGDVPGQSPARYVITHPTVADSMGFALTIQQPTLGMNTWLYRAWATDGTDEDTSTRIAPTVQPQVIPAPAFTCAVKDVLSKTEEVVVIGGSPANSAFTANCLPGAMTPDPGYRYTYWVRDPDAVKDSAQKGTGSAYTFVPSDKKGTYQVFFVISNQCGDVTAQDSVQAVENLKPKDVTAIVNEPDAEPGDAPIHVEGPSQDNITVELCEGKELELAATYEGGPAESIAWQTGSGDNWTDISISSPYSLRNDTLVINPSRFSELNGKQFRCEFKLPGSVAAISSPTITVHVNRKPDVSNTWVAIEDVDADPKLDTGQALPGNHVRLTAQNVPAGTTKVCFYQAFLNEEGEVDSVRPLPNSCGSNFTYELTDEATVAEHDATWYYVQVYNNCGYDTTRPFQLRIYDTLAIKWIPDTLIENPSGGWDYSDYDPEPGKVVVLIRPGQDSTQVAAHLWICQNEDIWFRDTTVSGFMNRESWEVPEDETTPNRGSRWFYRTSPDDEWTLFSPYDYPWSELDPIWEVQEHQGNFKSPMSDDPDFYMDGWEFRAAGVNALYSDTTCVLT
ncbi:MAG: hypothetical protein NC324_08720, partial [Bacteroides sp.]|nr:hypothetical protein [Bacteroides sp.]